MRTPRATSAVIVLALLGCAPALDWREVRIADTTASALFPCRPQRLTRRLALAGSAVDFDLHVCSADGLTWGLGTADLADPARVAAALAELALAARRNLDAVPSVGRPASVPGATPGPQMQRHDFDGRLPDGAAVAVHVLVFAKGTRVFQAVVHGPATGREAAEVFLGSIGAGA